MKSRYIATVGCCLLLLQFIDHRPGRAADTASSETPGAAEPTTPAEWFGAGVRPTEPRTPEEELAGFHVAPGFEVRLFAAEPQIAKPMNMAFDARARLWVTDSVEYPYPAPEGQTPRDAVRVLEDTDGDGRADKATVFADQLNVPIGVLPYGEGCICYSIPNIYYLRDTDSDGVCDRRDKILGPFDTTRDTHGMVNSLRMGLDGWIYANHGFNNQSQVAGADGHSITMVSGNTFRFRPDGSRVEHLTWGQVNPFGRAEDEWGYQYSADCHSKPISQLVDGGYYPSFGRPDDGLGFIPPMMDHLHGSTAISGVVYCPPTLGIDSLSRQMLSGNVMTSRINRNRVAFSGSTAQAIELPDFLTSDDPWFRPVDLRIGSDGNLYVADFYNRIIGHYEVPLEHPGRDRHRGRIWQIRPVDSARRNTDLTTVESITDQWSDAVPTRRRLAMEEALRRNSPAIDEQARQVIRGDAAAEARIIAMWYLARRDALDQDLVTRIASDASPIVRTHLQRVLDHLADRQDLPPARRESLASIALQGLQDDSPHVIRSAAEALAGLGAAAAVPEILNVLIHTDSADAVLRQTLRIAVRDLMRDNGRFQEVAESLQKRSPRAVDELASISLALRTEAAGEFLIAYLRSQGRSSPQVPEMLRHAVRLVASEGIDSAVEVARELVRDGRADEQEMISLVAAELDQAKEHSPALADWAEEIVRRDLDEVRTRAAQQHPLGIQWRDASGQPWPTQVRFTVDGRPVTVTSTFPLGESYTGVLLSDPFTAPETISFSIAGHTSHQDQDPARRNRIELVDVSTEDVIQMVLHRAETPARDAVARVTWDCSTFAGRRVRLRCTDTDSQTAFAWIAFGEVTPHWLDPTSANRPLERALRTISDFHLTGFTDALQSLLRQQALEPAHRARIGQTLAVLGDQRVVSILFSQWAEGGAGDQIPQSWIAAVSDPISPLDDATAVADLSRQLSTPAQNRLAERLAGDRELLGLLLRTIDSGALSPEVLLEKPVETRIAAVADETQQTQIALLKQRAKPAGEAAQSAMDRVLSELASGKHDVALGRELYTRSCALCHQIGGVGQVVGPQLDGVGGRGPARLLEDILMPDRNVDQAFRTTTFVTIDGRVLSGLVRSEDTQTVSLAGTDGKLFQIEVEQIDARREGTASLMPSNFHQTLTDQDLAAIVAYLTESARP